MESTSTIILILNFILQVFQTLDHSLIKRIKSSKCLCGEIQLDKYKDDMHPKGCSCSACKSKDDNKKDDPINNL